MKTVVFESLGLNVPLNVPADVAEYNALAPGRTNAVLEDATSNVVYRSALPVFRKAFVKKVEETTGVKRTLKTVNVGKPGPDGVQKTKEVPDETEKDYFDRVVASTALSEAKTEDEIRARFQPIADEIASTLKFDPSEDTSEGATRKPTKESLAVLAQLKTEGRVDAVRQRLASTYNVPVPETDDDTALLIAEHLRKTREAAAAAARNSLSAV